MKKTIRYLCQYESRGLFKLPERINNIIPIHLPKKAKDKYDQLERRRLLLPLKDSDIVANTAGVLANKLLQMSNGAVYDENGDVKEIHNAKLKALEDTIEAAKWKVSINLLFL